MAEDNKELLEQLESIELPKAMIASAQFIEALKRHAQNANPKSPEEAVWAQVEISGAHIGATLEMLANVGDWDRQLRQIGERLKALEG